MGQEAVGLVRRMAKAIFHLSSSSSFLPQFPLCAWDVEAGVGPTYNSASRAERRYLWA